MSVPVITLSLTLDKRYRNEIKYFKTSNGVAVACIRRQRKCQLPSAHGRTVYFVQVIAGGGRGFFTEDAAVRAIASKLAGRRG